MQSYFATRIGVPVARGTLQDAINFNNANSDAEMPFWGQEIFTEAEALLPGVNTPQTDPNLGVPVGTVMSRLHRARRRLRKQLTVPVQTQTATETVAT